MSDRTYVYIDGESHFIRSEAAWRALHGEGASLQRLRYVGDTHSLSVFVRPRAKVFWTRRMHPGADRVFYFSSAVGDEKCMHDIRVELRAFALGSV